MLQEYFFPQITNLKKSQTPLYCGTIDWRVDRLYRVLPTTRTILRLTQYAVCSNSNEMLYYCVCLKNGKVEQVNDMIYKKSYCGSLRREQQQYVYYNLCKACEGLIKRCSGNTKDKKKGYCESQRQQWIAEQPYTLILWISVTCVTMFEERNAKKDYDTKKDLLRQRSRSSITTANSRRSNDTNYCTVCGRCNKNDEAGKDIKMVIV